MKAAEVILHEQADGGCKGGCFGHGKESKNVRKQALPPTASELAVKNGAEPALHLVELDRYNSDVPYRLTSRAWLASTLRDNRAYPARAYKRDSGAQLLGETHE